MELRLRSSARRIGLVSTFVGQLILALLPSLYASLVDVQVTSYDDGTACNATLYDGWYDSPYSGALVADLTDFWLFSDAELTNGQALEVVSSTCLVMMNTLRLDRAGRNGPVADKYVYDVMCADECVLSDALREEAMSVAGCTCLQLSTQPQDPTYHTPGDWCTANSGRYETWTVNCFIRLQCPQVACESLALGTLRCSI